MKKIFSIITALIMLFFTVGTATAFAEDIAGASADNSIKTDGETTFLISDYADSNVLTASDGTKFAVNGNVSFSFYSEIDAKMMMNISMLGLEKDRRGLVFLNCTAGDEKITYDNAPDIEKAVGEGAIALSGYTDIDNISSESFNDYQYYVDIKKGENTVYIPSNNITNDCGKYAYEVGNVRCNSKVCFKSVSFLNIGDNYKIYANQIPKNNLTYHGSGQVLTGYDENDWHTDHTQRQSYESMYTIVPFHVSTAGDYVVNVYYNAYSSASVGTKIPAAVYVDADTSSLKNSEWLKFLDTQTYPASTRRETTDAHLRVITKDGTIEPVDLGNWMVSLRVEGDDSPPFYHLKSFRIDNLSEGDHTLLFYTAYGILDNTSAIVNKDVFFNSFEFKRITDDYCGVETQGTPVINKYVDSVYSALVPKTFTEAVAQSQLSSNAFKDTLYFPFTVANNTDGNISGILYAVFYKDGQLSKVTSDYFELESHKIYENLLNISLKDTTADSLRVFIWDNSSLKPYLTSDISLVK